MTEAERFAHRERVKAMQRQRENDLAQRQQLAAVGALKRWAAATPCTEHGYLTRKGIQPHGAKIEGDKLLILSRYTVLSHESHADYESLVNSLMDEHLPAGATEQHLIEELASVIWRKRRVLQAEGVTINKGLKESARNAKTVIPAAAPFEMGLSGEGTDIRNLMDLKPEDVTESQRVARHDLDATNKAAAILSKGGDRAYDRALRALLPDSREWWESYLEEEEYTPDAEGLATHVRRVHGCVVVLLPSGDTLDQGKRQIQQVIVQTPASRVPKAAATKIVFEADFCQLPGEGRALRLPRRHPFWHATLLKG